MFFVLSKIFYIVTVPSNLIVIAGLIGVALLRTRYAATGRRLVVASILLIAAIGFLPIGDMLARPLENRISAKAPLPAPPTGIIVLGGVIRSTITAVRGHVSLGAAAERLTAAVELARQYPDARIVFSSGNANLIGGRPEADFAVRFFESMGVAGSRVTVENQARNTAENAAFSKRLIDPKAGEHWLLITSAMHMPRAVGAFRQAGFPVVPYPVDYLTTGRRDMRRLNNWIVDGMRATDMAVHEWLGLFVYWISGRIPVFLPGPSRG